ncbi:Serine dehydrogenase proteinase [Cohaesibacter sp. ES.047]|nr:Serine dehydrogenase proteinase [Cohaesibacter sp. ES.047]
MSLDLFDRSIFDLVNERAKTLEDHLKADIIFYSGGINPNYFRNFRDYVEEMKSRSDRQDNAVAVFLRTGGGSAETAERMVAALRKHYGLVYFVVPDLAMSAGTILCMAGDKIYMDYSSSLGPIDPQVPAPDTGDYVPAMGYLDKVKEITEKGELAPADVVLLRSMDLGKLALFEQARDLSKDLLKHWLVEYKFKDWTHHRTNNPGSPVTIDEKRVRAEEIATALGDHTLWRSHGRSIDLPKLAAMRIEIDDYSDDVPLRNLIREYNDPLTGFIDRMGLGYFIHNHRVGL